MADWRLHITLFRRAESGLIKAPRHSGLGYGKRALHSSRAITSTMRRAAWAQVVRETRAGSAPILPARKSLTQSASARGSLTRK